MPGGGGQDGSPAGRRARRATTERPTAPRRGASGRPRPATAPTARSPAAAGETRTTPRGIALVLPWLTSERRRRELEHIREFYPGAHLQLPSTAGEPFVLFAQIKPSPDAGDRGRVLADLKRGMTVCIFLGSKTHHLQ